MTSSLSKFFAPAFISIALTPITLAKDTPSPQTLNPNLVTAVTSDDKTLVTRIRELILKTSKERTAEQMRPYRNTIPSTGAHYEMVTIPGGTFTMGSPADAPERHDDEGPQREIKIEPFLATGVTLNSNGIPRSLPKTAVLPDFVSSPSLPYLEMDFGMGKEDAPPAISMTHHAAWKFCQWLSAQTGHYYRLPTEAEWEYACRTGSTTTYHFGNNPEKLPEYAWYRHPESPDQYAKVGLKMPNA